MYELLKLFFDICLLKKAPQDVPGSTGMLRLLIPVYACVSFLILKINNYQLNIAFRILVEIGLILGLSWIILFFYNKSARYQQTASALMATDILISFFSLPAIASLMGQGAGLAFVAILLIMIWHWVVSGHIFRHALDQSFVFGLGVALLYIITSYQLIGLLFPEITSIE